MSLFTVERGKGKQPNKKKFIEEITFFLRIEEITLNITHRMIIVFFFL